MTLYNIVEYIWFTYDKCFHSYVTLPEPKKTGDSLAHFSLPILGSEVWRRKQKTYGSHASRLAPVWPSHRIGWWENLQENPIFHGKNHGFRLRFSQENQSSDQVPVREHVLLADLQSVSADPSGTSGTQWVDLEIGDQPVDEVPSGYVKIAIENDHL